MARDNRQFKGAPYQDPVRFPPPSEEVWKELGLTPPLPNKDAAKQQTGRTYSRNKKRR